ncbi:MAG: hypothetical protein JXB60_04875 [Candidatus Cloacimonetes bacterium]|nr:hypothetical protein [Candidatus Cloacimonadota bacterium]
MKKIFPRRIKLIQDWRGALTEELSAGKDRNGTDKIKQMESLEKKLLTLADMNFCVSEALEEYLVKKYEPAPETRFFIMPCLAEEELFYYSSKLREKIRKKMNWDRRIVLVYAGALKAGWHVPDYTFAFFRRINNMNPAFFLQVLTGDLELAERFRIKHVISEQDLIILKADNREVNHYLNGADFGLLFREDRILNNVASPTKFAEYMLAGLPVIISPRIGDYSRFVQERNCGFVLPYHYQQEDLEAVVKKVQGFYTGYHRMTVAENNRGMFSKSAILSRVMDQFRSL